jgi:hypothetical protein
VFGAFDFGKAVEQVADRLGPLGKAGHAPVGATPFEPAPLEPSMVAGRRFEMRRFAFLRPDRTCRCEAERECAECRDSPRTMCDPWQASWRTRTQSPQACGSRCVSRPSFCSGTAILPIMATMCGIRGRGRRCGK